MARPRGVQPFSCEEQTQEITELLGELRDEFNNTKRLLKNIFNEVGIIFFCVVVLYFLFTLSA